MTVALMEQEQADDDEEVRDTRVTRRTTRGTASMAQVGEIVPAPPPVAPTKKRTRSQQKAEEAEDLVHLPLSLPTSALKTSASPPTWLGALSVAVVPRSRKSVVSLVQRFPLPRHLMMRLVSVCSPS